MKRPALKYRVACIALALLPALATTSLAADESLPPREKTGGVDLGDPAVIARGLDLIGKTCGGYCHGTAGRGLKAPALRNRTDLAWDSLHATISFGRKRAGKMMPAWKGSISDEDIWAAVAAILSLRHVDGDAVEGSKASSH